MTTNDLIALVVVCALRLGCLVLALLAIYLAKDVVLGVVFVIFAAATSYHSGKRT